MINTPEQIAAEEAARAFPEADHRAERCKLAILAALRRQSPEAAQLIAKWRTRAESHTCYPGWDKVAQAQRMCAAELEAALSAPGSTPTQEEK